jgi:hypothetical protein
MADTTTPIAPPWATAANAIYIGGGALVTTALVLWLWPE